MSPSADSRVAALREAVRDVPDFPKPGIVFKDITPVLGDAARFREAMDLMTELVRDLRPEQVVAVESRGFVFGSVLADRLGAGFVPVRKPGKLPWKRLTGRYDLEYGTDAVEIHEDALKKGARTLIVDDVIATGGTARATAQLVEQLGAEVLGHAFLIELTFLKGRDRLAPHEVRSLIRY
jgi:adenine phosphoribosyltransferase